MIDVPLLSGWLGRPRPYQPRPKPKLKLKLKPCTTAVCFEPKVSGRGVLDTGSIHIAGWPVMPAAAAGEGGGRLPPCGFI